MKRFAKTLALATLGFSTTFGSMTTAEACPGGGRTTYRTTYRPTTVYYRPAQPACVQPAQQPPQMFVHPQQQQFGGQQFPGQQPVQGQPQFAGQPGQGQPFAGQQAQFQGQGGQPFAGQQTQFQGQPGQQPQQFAGQPQAGQQQLRAQGGGQPGQFAGQQQALPQRQGVAPQGQGQQPVAQQQQPQQQVQQQQVQQPQAPSVNSAQQSALQMLSEFGGGTPAAAAPAPVQQGASRVGTWVATLPNQATVQLTLGADGGFSWVATANGKTSTFAGTYNFNGGSLTLERSTDSQKLAGTLTEADADNFIFKLEGAADGLKFARR